jgi:hypothetical protein
MGWFVCVFLCLTPAECFASGFRSYSTRTSFSPVFSDDAKITSRSTTYVGQVMAYQNGEEPDADIAVRKGEFAMLIYSIGQQFVNRQTFMTAHVIILVAVVAGTLLPQLAVRDRRLMPYASDVSDDAELNRLRDTVRRWRAEAARKGLPVRLPVMPFLLRNIWTGALLLFTLLTFWTFFITTVAEVCPLSRFLIATVFNGQLGNGDD